MVERWNFPSRRENIVARNATLNSLPVLDLNYEQEYIAGKEKGNKYKFKQEYILNKLPFLPLM